MALARLATEGFPVACEGDVDGALGCLVGKLLGCGAVYLSDWLEHDAGQLTLWHGGMAPLQLRCVVQPRPKTCVFYFCPGSISYVSIHSLIQFLRAVRQCFGAI